MRATLRRALATGGVPFQAKYRGKRPRKPRLVLLCDVSDSVRASARFMLLFVHAVQRLFEDARSFVFVSDLAERSDRAAISAVSGVPAFGVSGLFSDPTVDARAHGRDERMRVQSYYEGQEFLYRLTKALTATSRTAQ